MNEESSSETKSSEENEDAGCIECIIGYSVMAFLCLVVLWLVLMALGAMAISTKQMFEMFEMLF